MGSDEFNPGLPRVSELEPGQAGLRAQFDELAQDQRSRREKVEEDTSSSGGLTFPGNFRNQYPYDHVLNSIGHAVYVAKASSGEIMYWNCAAEKLYGWKDYEVIGRCFWEFLIEEDFAPFINKIMEKLQFGQSWSGQFPFKKRSSEMFMAMVTKSPLYEDGELAGVVTVSSDAAVFNSMNSNQPRVSTFNMKGIQWPSRPQIASVPQMASSISDLVLKVLSRRCSDDLSRDGDVSVSEAECVNPDRQDIDMAKSRDDGKSWQKEESAVAQPVKFVPLPIYTFKLTDFVLHIALKLVRMFIVSGVRTLLVGKSSVDHEPCKPSRYY